MKPDISGRAVLAMYHTLEFAVEFMVDLEVSRNQPLERILIKRGTRTRAQLKPYVLEGDDGPIEVADLFLEDGTSIRGVRFDWFSFVD
jgi:hypothetical protein